MIAKGVDENGKEFEEKININDINLRNASYVEMSALEIGRASCRERV